MILLLGDPLFEHISIVSCQGVEQLGGLILGAPGLVPLRLRLARKSPCIENKENLFDFYIKGITVTI